MLANCVLSFILCPPVFKQLECCVSRSLLQAFLSAGENGASRAGRKDPWDVTTKVEIRADALLYWGDAPRLMLGTPRPRFVETVSYRPQGLWHLDLPVLQWDHSGTGSLQFIVTRRWLLSCRSHVVLADARTHCFQLILAYSQGCATAFADLRLSLCCRARNANCLGRPVGGGPHGIPNFRGLCVAPVGPVCGGWRCSPWGAFSMNRQTRSNPKFCS